MTGSSGSKIEAEGELKVNPAEFTPLTLEDELRVDRLWQQLLQRFYTEQQEAGLSPADATQLASSADYYIRDFVVGAMQLNLFEERTGLVRRFAGNWYIVNTLEPDAAELQRHLQGIGAFYRFLHAHQLFTAAELARIEEECSALDYYGQRIESFWAIQGDGYLAWERECSLKRGSL